MSNSWIQSRYKRHTKNPILLSVFFSYIYFYVQITISIKIFRRKVENSTHMKRNSLDELKKGRKKKFFLSPCLHHFDNPYKFHNNIFDIILFLYFFSTNSIIQKFPEKKFFFY